MSESNLISIEQFAAVDIRAGVVVSAETFPEARKPAYRLTIDFGPLGTRRSSAQITQRYTPEELVGRQVLAVVNLPPRQVATLLSEVLVLGFPVEGTAEVVLVAPDTDVAPGSRLA